MQQREVKLNWYYTEMKLKELHITEFERKNRKLGKKLFSENSLENKLRKYKTDKKPVIAGTEIKYYP